ncbi:hypothetical protein HDV06_004842, partial [Boothiomyces sp. JEL0866]
MNPSYLLAQAKTVIIINLAGTFMPGSVEPFSLLEFTPLHLQEVLRMQVAQFLGKAELDETFLVGHFQPDEDTRRDASVITELDETSPLFKYQRLEDERFFNTMYKADRAHLIDKGLCEQGKQYAKFYNNENNFLALSKEVYAWFAALADSEDHIPFFKLVIKEVSPTATLDAFNQLRYRVILIVEAYNEDTARL